MTTCPPPGPSAAFFDLDRTLISGSSAFVLGIAAWRGKLVPTHQFVRDAFSALTRSCSRAPTTTRPIGVRDRILGAVKGVRLDDLVALNADIVPKLMERVRPESMRLIEQHRDAGRATYIVSASPIELVEPLAKALGMTAGIGTRSAIVDGVYTGDLAGPFCYGPGKVEAIQEIVAAERASTSNGAGRTATVAQRSARCCEAVGHPVAVNPDAQLERSRRPAAAGRSWSSASAARRSSAAPRRPSARSASPSGASPAASAGRGTARASQRGEAELA